MSGGQRGLIAGGQQDGFEQAARVVAQSGDAGSAIVGEAVGAFYREIIAVNKRPDDAVDQPRHPLQKG